MTARSALRASLSAVAAPALAALLVAGPASAVPIVLNVDADTYLRDATPRGALELMDVRGGNVDFRGYLRFDLSVLTDPILHASLTLTLVDGASRNDSLANDRFALYGLTGANGNTSQSWDEAMLVPGIKGTEDVTTLAGVVDLDDNVAGISEVITGVVSQPGATITISGAPLVAFLQSRLGDGGLATFILSNDLLADRGYGLASKENSIAAYRPFLTVDAFDSVSVSEPSTLGLLGIGIAAALTRRRSRRSAG